MKTTIEAAIIVEGTSDVAFLSNFIDAEMIITNGSDVPRGTLDYIKSLSKIKPIIVLVDPDGPGIQIRHRLDKEIPGLIHVFLPKTAAIKNGKVGIAQSSAQAVLEALRHPIETKQTTLGKLTISDLRDLGLVGTNNSSRLRDFVSTHFHLGHNNGKQLLYRLNNLNIDKITLLAAMQQHE